MSTVVALLAWCRPITVEGGRDEDDQRWWWLLTMVVVVLVMVRFRVWEFGWCVRVTREIVSGMSDR